MDKMISMQLFLAVCAASAGRNIAYVSAMS
jgi:hypothetical protein